MPTSEVDARIKRLEGRFDKAATLLESADRALEKIELALEHAKRARRVSLVLVAASTALVLADVFVRRQQEA